MFENKILIFDFDGVIADSEKYHLEASKQAVKQLGISIDITPYFGIGLSDKMIYRQIEKDFNTTLPCDEIVKLKADIFEDMSSKIDMFPEIEKLILTLPNDKIILTNSQIPYVENCLLRWGIKKYFKNIISLYNVPMSKADMIINLGYNPKDCVYFDDAVDPLKEAEEKGILGIWVDNGVIKG